MIVLRWLLLASVVYAIYRGRRLPGALLALPHGDDEQQDARIEQLGRVLARGLGLERSDRSHRRQSLTLAGQLDSPSRRFAGEGGRSCELRLGPRGYVVVVGSLARLPSPIVIRRLAPDAPRSADDTRAHRVVLGRVRDEVPLGLVPALLSVCDERVEGLRLEGDRLELAREVSLRELADRPEEVVAFVKRGIALVERLEHRFRTG